jgi:hypothetical protein
VIEAIINCYAKFRTKIGINIRELLILSEQRSAVRCQRSESQSVIAKRRPECLKAFGTKRGDPQLKCADDRYRHSPPYKGGVAVGRGGVSRQWSADLRLASYARVVSFF